VQTSEKSIFPRRRARISRDRGGGSQAFAVLYETAESVAPFCPLFGGRLPPGAVVARPGISRGVTDPVAQSRAGRSHLQLPSRRSRRLPTVDFLAVLEEENTEK